MCYQSTIELIFSLSLSLVLSLSLSLSLSRETWWMKSSCDNSSNFNWSITSCILKMPDVKSYGLWKRKDDEKKDTHLFVSFLSVLGFTGKMR